MLRFRLVRKYHQAQTNAIHFFKVLAHPWSKANKRLSYFLDWYYFPEYDNLAPGKFIGYVDTTLKNYTGAGPAYHARRALGRFFVKLNPEDPLFVYLYRLLKIKYFPMFGKQINESIKTRGGIYVPNYVMEYILVLNEYL